ncbi:MAG: DUF3256 family protein [Bacteroidales bacterium]|nr:DUF3256 family protein [Bacteroidales bacterium]
MKFKLLALLFLSSFVVSAQYISPFFTAMPGDMLPYLSENNRKDLIDLYKSGKTPKVENLLKGTSQLKVLKEDFISIQLSESSSAELKLLPTSDSTKIITFIKTVCGKACDSKIEFFTTSWKSINSSDILPTISISDFIKNPTNEDLVRAIDIPFLVYSFEAESQQLTVSLDAKNWLNKEDFEKFSPDLRSSLVLKWSNGKFVKE